MKFAHLGDCHLGGWRHQELRDLNLQSFQLAINICIREKVDFILIAGDLFDSAYPPLNTLKETFKEFRKISDAKIPVFIIAGSHDYSVSGKTFLDVLEKAGFCRNIGRYEIRGDKLMLIPTIFKNVALYGYPGKKSALEVDELNNIKLHDAPGLFKILMLHTAIRDAVPNQAIKALDQRTLPKVDYLALGHLHINYTRPGICYSGPIFPNNISELEELKSGFFYIYDNGALKKQSLIIKDVVCLNLEIKDALSATDKIISELEIHFLKDKIVIFRLKGILEKGKTSDINFSKIENHVKERGAFIFLKSTSQLHMAELEIKLDLIDSENLESQIIDKFKQSTPNKFNSLINDLVRSLQIEKHDDETSLTFQDRLHAESKKVLGI